MVSHKIVSADSHMTEPADLWVQRLDKKFRDNAPRVIKNEKPNGPAYLFVGPGIHPLAVETEQVADLFVSIRHSVSMP